MRLSDLPNIGIKLESLLIESGIRTPEELQQIGSVNAIRKLGLTGNTCYNKLYALEGAIQGIRWHDLSKEKKSELKDKLNRGK